MEISNQPNPYQNIPTAYTTPAMSGILETGRSASLIRELNPREDLHDVMEQLKGRIWDIRLQKYIVMEGVKPILNEEGRDMFFHFATCMINAIVTMSNYTNDYFRIHGIVRMVIKDASIHFHLHWKEYGITRKTKITVITSKLMILGLSSLYKALGAGDRKAATSHISESISTLNRGDMPTAEQQKRRSMLGRMFGGKTKI